MPKTKAAAKSATKKITKAKAKTKKTTPKTAATVVAFDRSAAAKKAWATIRANKAAA